MGYKGNKMNTNTYTPSKELLKSIFDGLSGINISQINSLGIYISVGYFLDEYSFKSELINTFELAIKTKQKYPDLDLNLAATDISEFWRQANELVRGANNV